MEFIQKTRNFIVKIFYNLLGFLTFWKKNDSFVSDTNLGKGIHFIKKATEADTKKNYIEALKFYEKAIEYFLLAIETEVTDNARKEKIQSKVGGFKGRVDKIKKYLDQDSSLIMEKQNADKIKAQRKLYKEIKEAQLNGKPIEKESYITTAQDFVKKCFKAMQMKEH